MDVFGQSVHSHESVVLDQCQYVFVLWLEQSFEFSRISSSSGSVERNSQPFRVFRIDVHVVVRSSSSRYVNVCSGCFFGFVDRIDFVRIPMLRSRIFVLYPASSLGGHSAAAVLSKVLGGFGIRLVENSLS